jgi:hypothetical protein
MIELPLDSTPSKEFSVSTPVGVLRFKTQWDSFLGQWLMDIISPTGETWLNRVVITAGTDNLLDGCGIPELRDCAMFAIYTKDAVNDWGGNHKLDLFNDIGTTYRVFMTFPGDTVINPFTTTF